MKKFFVIIRLCRVNELGLIFPFAIISVLMMCGTDFDLRLFLFTLTALSCGFMAGCTFNGLSDKNFDKKNPRTCNRPMASGKIKSQEAFIIIAALSILTVIFTLLINPYLVFLLPIPASLCFFYSLSKRYTWFCHFLIGIIHAISPISVGIVFDKVFTLKTFFIVTVVVMSTVETDLLYSIQDAEYDAMLKLKSIPAVFGIKTAMVLSFICYLISLCAQIFLYFTLSFGLVPIIIAFFANILLLKYHISINLHVTNSRKILTVYQIFIFLITIATMIEFF